MKKQCEHCGSRYEAKRKTSRYCSAQCRVQAGRVSVTNSVTKLSKPGVSVTKEAVSVPISVTKSRVSVTSLKNVTLKKGVSVTKVSVPACEKIPKFKDCSACERLGKSCECQWWWNAKAWEHVDSYHQSYCMQSRPGLSRA